MNGIIMSGESVRAILDGRKTQTRRIVKPQPKCYGPNLAYRHDPEPSDFFLSAELHHLRCRRCGTDPQYSMEGSDTAHYWKPRYHKGETVYVKEGFAEIPWVCSNGSKIIYRADNPGLDQWRPDKGDRWNSPLFMPERLSRIHLTFDDVRVERLNDIDESGVAEEGYAGLGHFINGWGEINGHKSWYENPWVWVYKFKREEGSE